MEVVHYIQGALPKKWKRRISSHLRNYLILVKAKRPLFHQLLQSQHPITLYCVRCSMGRHVSRNLSTVRSSSPTGFLSVRVKMKSSKRFPPERTTSQCQPVSYIILKDRPFTSPTMTMIIKTVNHLDRVPNVELYPAHCLRKTTWQRF